MLISNKPMLNTGSFSVKIGNTAIAASNSIKYLGVLFDDKINWDKHIQHVIFMLSSAIAILHKLKFYAPSSLLEKVYYGIVYPHLSYAITTWGNAASTRLNNIQVMQNRLVRIITKKCDRKTRMSPLYKQFSILNLSNIFKLEVTKFMSKIKNNNLPELFLNYFYSAADIYTNLPPDKSDVTIFFCLDQVLNLPKIQLKCVASKCGTVYLCFSEKKVQLGKRTFIKSLKKFLINST